VSNNESNEKNTDAIRQVTNMIQSNACRTSVLRVPGPASAGLDPTDRRRMAIVQNTAPNATANAMTNQGHTNPVVAGRAPLCRTRTTTNSAVNAAKEMPSGPAVLRPRPLSRAASPPLPTNVSPINQAAISITP